MKTITIIFILAVGLVSCKKDEEPTNDSNPTPTVSYTQSDIENTIVGHNWTQDSCYIAYDQGGYYHWFENDTVEIKTNGEWIEHNADGPEIVTWNYTISDDHVDFTWGSWKIIFLDADEFIIEYHGVPPSGSPWGTVHEHYTLQ